MTYSSLKRLLWYAGAALLAVLLVSIAQGAFAADGAVSTDGANDVVKLVANSAKAWGDPLKKMALHMFYGLLLLELVWEFAQTLLRGRDISDVVWPLIRLMMMAGFFRFLIMNGPELCGVVIDSFRKAAGIAGNVGDLTPGDVFGVGITINGRISDAVSSSWNPAVAIMGAACGLMVVASFCYLAALFVVTLIEATFVMWSSVLFLGFAGSRWTREFSQGMIRYAVSVGAKLFTMILLVGLIKTATDTWAAGVVESNASIFTLAGLSFMAAILGKNIPSMVQAVVNGQSANLGGAIGQMGSTIAAAVTTAATAGAGAMAGASMGAKAAGGASEALEAAGGLSNAMGGSSMGGMGGASAGGPSPMSSISGGSSIGGGASPAPVPSTGGGQAAASAGQSGGAPDPFNATPSMPSQSEEKAGAASEQPSSEQPASGSAATASEQATQQTGGSAAAAPKSEGGFKPSGSKREAAVKLANAGVKGVGTLAALTVPGAEQAGALGISMAPPSEAGMPGDTNEGENEPKLAPRPDLADKKEE